jgi:hypothetical protein
MTSYRIAVALAVAVFASSGCSESSRAISPLSPSPAPVPSGAPGARVTGTVVGGSTGATVAVDGTGISDDIDGAGHFELTGVPAGDIELRFDSGGVGAALPIAAVAEQDQIEINVTLTGGSATLDRMQRRSPDHSIEVKGVVSSVSGSCPTLRFSVGGTTIATDGATRFEDGTCGAIQNGVRVEAKGTLQPDGSLLAHKVDIDHPDPSPSVELKGPVASRSGTCPSLTFTVNGTTVVTNNLTRFEDGPCSDVQNGTRVEVKGIQQSNGSVLASKVDIDRPDPPNPTVELKGIVAGRSGACPALTFTVNGTAISTNGATRFEDGLCSDVVDGTRVEVKGSRQAGGSVLATKVDIDRPDPPDPDVKVQGSVTGRSGACPAITFTVSSTTIVTNASTRIEDGLCTDIQNGTEVEVKGTRQANGSVLAEKVDIDRADPEVELKGIVSNLGAACPNRTFTVNGTAVVTNSATRFEDGPCSALQNGNRVEVKGTRQSNGSVLARKVDIDH